jgi:hypothetical protein
MSKNERIVIETAGVHEGEKTLSCSQAFRLSSKQGISLEEIGELCNKNGIKIISCQLGCFK